jgi:hypothetical protein
VRFVLLGALASLWVLSPAAVAVAHPSIEQEFTVELSGTHFLSSFCGFTIVQEGTAHVMRTTFEDGRVIEHVDVDLELMANGRVAFEMPRFNVQIDPAAGTVTLTGTLVNIHAPGEGLLLQEVGRVVQGLATGDPLFSAGRFMIMGGSSARSAPTSRPDHNIRITPHGRDGGSSPLLRSSLEDAYETTAGGHARKRSVPAAGRTRRWAIAVSGSCGSSDGARLHATQPDDIQGRL